jgi:hypothetical protein
MQSPLLSALRAQQPEIRARWAMLLRVELISNPLAHPDALVHLIDWSLEEIFRGLSALASRRRGAQYDRPVSKPHCPCGRNPLLVYFAAGRQAVQEALVLAQAQSPGLEPIERDAAMRVLNLVLDHTARREIESFCGVCQHRQKSLSCDHRSSLLIPTGAPDTNWSAATQ